MLYKPTNPTPYNGVIDPTTGINFNASCINTNEISKVRLTIDNNSYKYYFDMGNDCYSNGEITINVNNSQSKSGYRISNSNYKREDVTSVSLCGNTSSLIHTSQNYRWQIRLYQNSCNVNIAYGFIQSIYKTANDFGNTITANQPYNSNATHILKVRPHTNMFYYVDNSAIKTAYTGYNKNINLSLLSYYDNDVKYKIEINGKQYDVLSYYYGYKNSESDTSRSNIPIETDSYGDPLFAYIEINTSDDDISVEDEYSIYTNYIDSNEFYFQCKSSPKLDLYIQPTGLNKMKLPIADGIFPSTEENNLRLIYNTLNIQGDYSQSNGASVSYYRVCLYQIMPNKTEFLLEDTGNIYKSYLTYEYSDFFNGNLYKLVFQLKDTNNKSIVKSIYITPDYKALIKPRNLNVFSYPEHQSILIDFDGLKSISGHEGIAGSHEFSELFVTQNANGSFEISPDNNDSSETMHINSCYVYDNNFITYEQIDNSSSNISCVRPLLSMAFRCNDKNGRIIFELIDDNDHKYILLWYNYTFIYYYYSCSSNRNYTTVKYITPYFGSGFPHHALGSPLCTMEQMQELQSKVETALSDKNLNYTVPYLAFDNLPTGTSDGTDLYCHTEDISIDFWWHIIVTTNQLYLKCLNPPANTKIEYERKW